MSRLGITLGCWNYDRTRALMEGTVQPDGIDLNYLSMPVEETFFRMLRYREFEAAELSLSSYSVSASRPERPFIAIPVFPSRFFRHNSIYTNAKSGIREPKDLIGKRVGVPEYQQTAGLWVRGIMRDQHGVDTSKISWVTGGQVKAGSSERISVALPPQFDVKPIGPTQTLDGMLAAGEIDAIFSPRPPASLADKSVPVDSLFPNYRDAEMDYFRKTKFFPIMHTLCIRKDIAASGRPATIQGTTSACSHCNGSSVRPT